MADLRGLSAGAMFTLACAPGPQPNSWFGEWEGFVEATNQSVFSTVRLERADSAWTGEVRLPGIGPVAIAPDIRHDTIRFTIDLGPQQIAFTGLRSSDSLTGDAAIVDGPTFPFFLRHLPARVPPKTRVDAWFQDLEHVDRRFLAYDRSYSADARDAAHAHLRKLHSELPSLSDPEVMVRLSRIAALADNAHTRMYLLRNRLSLRRYPLRLWWFSDGLYVVRASETHADLLGCRVTSIAETDVNALRTTVGELFAGNTSWVEYKSPYFMASPEVLMGVGVLSGTDRALFDVVCRDGAVRQSEVAPDRLIKLDQPTENWWSLTPLFQDTLTPQLSAFDTARSAVPPYLQRPSEHYWVKYFTEPEVLFIQYNRSQNMPAGPPFADFAATVFASVDAHDLRAVVVDLRFNTGGNIGIARNFFAELAEHPGVADRLFVITGPATFSAGLFHAAQLKESGRATLVGAHPGDHLDFWSEGGNIVLPNSGFTMHFANGFHSGSPVPPPPGVRVVSDLSVESLEPDIPVGMTFQQYRAGVDPMLDAIISLTHDR